MTEQAERPPSTRPVRRPGLILAALVVVLLVLVGVTVFDGLYTEMLWFASVGYGEVFQVELWTKVGLFFVFGAGMALIVGLNATLAFRRRPLAPWGADRATVARYRASVSAVRWPSITAVSALIGVFAGASAAGQWRTFLLWEHGQPFGTTDPYFHKDIGFYVFTLPWLHYLVGFFFTATLLALIASALVHYLFGGIRFQGADRLSVAAGAQLSLLGGVLLLVKGIGYWLSRYDLTTATGGIVTGMTYARDHATLPARSVLTALAVIVAILLFINVWRRSWLLVGVGLALFAICVVALGGIWPALVEKFEVKPDEPDKEAIYIAANMAATKQAYGLTQVTTKVYRPHTTLSKAALARDAASLEGVRLLDPAIASATFDQLQQVKAYYSVPGVLDVDQYPVDGRERDLVVTARELNLAGLPNSLKSWANEHTVYTHGYGMIAAFGNQRDAANQPVNNDGKPAWAESGLPPHGQLSDQPPGHYVPQIYFGENSPPYSIVGEPPGGPKVELDLPAGSGISGRALMTTYHGHAGVGIGSMFRRLLYAVKFGDPNILLSSRVNGDSRILYNRSVRQRVQEVAPWLTLDSNPLPAVVNGRIDWIIDGYTTTNRYPGSQENSMSQLTSDAINPQNTFGALPNDQLNYIRNSVKAVVDAYSGTVTLYAWDPQDPILKAWMAAFPGVIKPRSDIPSTLLQHMRYPEDLFKVQRAILARYHVATAGTFYGNSDQWDVPQDPTNPTRKQPPYRLSVATTSGGRPVFSLTSVYVPTYKENMAAFITVGADAAQPSTYGKFTILRLPDNSQVPGPSQMENLFLSDRKVADQRLAFTRGGARVLSGNLLTLPVGGGLMYAEPLYTVRRGGQGNYPLLRFVMVSFGKSVGIGTTLASAIDRALGITPTTTTPSGGGQPPKSGGGGPKLSTQAVRLLQQANALFAKADQALKAGHLASYANNVRQAQALIRQALADATTKSHTPPDKGSGTGSSGSGSGKSGSPSTSSSSPSKRSTHH